MNDAIQKQLEERLAEVKHYAGIEGCFTPLDEYAEDFARECAALRRLCANTLEWCGDLPTKEEMERLRAAAEGRPVI